MAGPQRTVAVSRFREMLAADVVGQLDALAANGWDPADMGDAVASYISWIYRQVDEAVDAGLERWGGLS